MSAGQICFSHGQESGPWGTKIRGMAEVAQAMDWQVESLDYQGMADPLERVARLTDWCAALSAPPVLVGSSMGGFVALAAAARRPVRGLFLLAPALYLPGYAEHLPAELPDCPIRIVHGWGDDVVPPEGSQRFAAESRSELLLVDGDHRLTEKLPAICRYLQGFLEELG